VDAGKILNARTSVKKEAIAKLTEKGGEKSLEALVLLSLDRDPGVRYHAQKGLGELRGQLMALGREVDGKIRDFYISSNIRVLRTGSPEDSLEAAKRLSRTDAGTFARDLVDVLRSSTDDRLTATLLKTIAHACGSRSLNLLKSYLKSPDPRIRANAVEAISTLEIAERFDLVMPFLRDESGRVAANAAMVLWGFSRIKVLGRLREMILSDNRNLASSAVWCLKEIGTVESLKILSAIPSHHAAYESAREGVAKITQALAITARGLSPLKSDTSDTANQPDSAVQKQYSDRTGPIEESSVSASPPSPIPSPASSPDEMVLAQSALDKLSSEDPRVRLDGAKELAELRRTDLVPTLANILEKDSDRFVVATLVKLVGLTGGADYAGRIIPFLEHEDPRVRANAVEGLSLVEDEAHLQPVAKLLSDGDARVSANAAFVMYRKWPERTLDILTEMISSGDPWRGASAAFALGRLGDDSCETILRESRGGAPEEVRQRIDEILVEMDNRRHHEAKVIAEEVSTAEKLPHDNAQDALLDLASPAPGARARAVKTLSLLADETTVPQLMVLFRNEEKGPVQAQILKLIALAGKEKTMDFLLEQLSGSSASVRLAAAEALAGSSDPRAAEALMEILRKNEDQSLISICLKGIISSGGRDSRDEAREMVRKMAISDSSLDRERAVRALDGLTGPWADNLMERLARDNDVSVANAAGACIRRREEEAALKIREVTNQVGQDLSQLDSTFIEANRNYLIDIQVEQLSSQDQAGRSKTLTNLDMLLCAETLDHFRRLLMSQQNKFIKATLIKTVGKLKVQRTISILEPFLKDYDPRVRANCIEALTGFRDPIIFDMVSPLLNDPDERVKNNGYRLLADTFPIQTKSRLMDMLQESRSYTRTVRAELFESANFILANNQDQICRELREWLEGRRQEDPVELEKARMREEDSFKRVDRGSQSRPHVITGDEDVFNLYKFLGKIALFTMVLFTALIYLKYYGPDKPKVKRMTYSAHDGGYDGTAALEAFSAMPEPGSTAPARIRRRTRFTFSAAPAFMGRNFDRTENTIARARAQTEKLLDSAQVENTEFRNLMLNAAGGNERIIRAEESLARGSVEEALSELREALSETPESEIPTRCRIMFSMLQCLRKLKRSEEYASLSETFDMERQKVGELSFRAGLYTENDGVSLEKLKADSDAIKSMKTSVQSLEPTARESFLESLRKELISSGLKGAELEFEFSVLKKRFGL
jgi:HEAT repeat protein